MKILITVILLTVLYRQRNLVLSAVWHLIVAIDAVWTAWREM